MSDLDIPLFPEMDDTPNPKPMSPSETAKLRGERGTQVAAENAGKAWRVKAFDYVESYLRHHAELMPGAIWEHGLTVPDSPRAFGHVIKALLAAGVMEHTGRSEPSPQSNGSRKPVYRSLVFTPDASDIAKARHSHRDPSDDSSVPHTVVPSKNDALDALEVLSHFAFTGAAGDAYAVLIQYVSQHEGHDHNA